jgi:fused signal recognition particle receptor
MDPTVIVVIVLLVVAAGVALALTRKKPSAELPESPAAPKLPAAKGQREAERAPAKAATPAQTAGGPAGASGAPSPIAAEDISVEDIAAPARAPEAPARAQPKRPSLEPRSDLESMRRGLAKSRESGGFFGRLFAVFGGRREISPEIVDQIEEVLLTSDVGVETTQAILARVREALGRGEAVDADKVWAALREEAVRILSAGGKAGPFALTAKPLVVLLVGVNGAGKTTTIGKLATRFKANGLECVLAAGDTFRAAAVQQLGVWGQRVGCEVVKGKEGADPGSVVFDAIRRAQEIGADVVLADTAGRLHTKANLMAEMKKIAKTAEKALPGAPHEVLLVLDATNGQNALAQAREFRETLDVTGIVLTKLDGTAKGGMVLGISDTLGTPVRFVGLGERPGDLHDFVPEEFVEALLGKDAKS